MERETQMVLHNGISSTIAVHTQGFSNKIKTPKESYGMAKFALVIKTIDTLRKVIACQVIGSTIFQVFTWHPNALL